MNPIQFTNPKVLNLDVFHELQMMTRREDESLFSEMLEAFLATSASRLEAMEIAAGLDENAEVAGIARAMSSAAKALGADRVSDICDLIEEKFSTVALGQNWRSLVTGLSRELVLFRDALNRIAV